MRRLPPAIVALLLTATLCAAAPAQRVLEATTWEPAPFEVRCFDESIAGSDAVLRFDSPRPSGDALQDQVTLLWYAARDEEGKVVEAPAIVVVHTLHPQMIIGQAIARGLAAKGVHAFMIQLPGYGERRPAAGRGTWWTAMIHAGQAVADVRRARDAVAALPEVAGDTVALEGTSLGGFIASVAAALDGAFDPVFLALSGADAFSVIQTGQMDAAYVREALVRAGVSDEELRKTLAAVEPIHVANRLDPQRTWLFTATHDQVVPAASSDAFVEAAQLPADHHVALNGDHYTATLLLPAVIDRIARIIHGEPVGDEGSR